MAQISNARLRALWLKITLHLTTAKANDREPYAWLRFVLERLPLAKTVDEIEALLPWNVHDQDLAMNLAAWE